MIPRILQLCIAWYEHLHPNKDILLTISSIGWATLSCCVVTRFAGGERSNWVDGIVISSLHRHVSREGLAGVCRETNHQQRRSKSDKMSDLLCLDSCMRTV